MSIKINKKISKYNHYDMDNRKIKYIVIHWVGSAQSAKNNADYFYSADRSASAHYFVADKEIWQSVLDKNAAWAVGGGPLDQASPYAKYGKKYFNKCTNSNSISIEMCCKKNSQGKLYITDETIDLTAELVQMLQKKYSISDKNVIRHFDVNGKLCPGTYIEELKWEKLHSILVGNYFKVRTKGKLIAREKYTLTSKKTRNLEEDKVYGIIKTKKVGTILRGKLVKGDWISLSSKFVDIL